MGSLQPLRTRLSALFATPRSQAYGSAVLGIAGVLAGAIGIWLLTSGGNSGGGQQLASADDIETPTATATAPRPSATPTNTPLPTASAPPRRALTPRATPTPTTGTLALSGGSGGGGGPAATPTPPPVSAAGDYCDTVGGLNPPAAIYGTIAISGSPAPAGTAVTLLFDGAAGPSILTTDAGGYKVLFAEGGGNCANNRAASISIAVGGTVIPTGLTVASGDSGGVRFDIVVP